MGNRLTVGAGLEGDETYAFASYDLGGGATAFVDYTDAADNSGLTPAGDDGLVEFDPSERDILAGTTVGVSFTFLM